MNRVFWREVVLTGITLTALVILESSATTIYTMSHGRKAAMMIELMGSRAILFNPGITGYYERIFSAKGRTVDARQAKWLRDDRVYDPFRVYRLRPNLKNLGEWWATDVPTNSYGYVGREWSLHKAHNTRRVALLGDSVTEGWGVNLDQSFGALLENRLNATRPDGASQRFEVLSFSVGGYHLTQILDVAVEDAPRFEPDVYMLALTELSVFRSWDTHMVDMISLGIDPKYDFLRETIRRAGVSREDDGPALYAKLAPFRIAVVREMLLEMKSNAERRHAQFIVVLVPTLEDADLTRKRFEGIPELLASLQITTVNLLDTFDGVPDVVSLRTGRSDVHPNAQGHGMIAENLYSKLHAQPSAWSDLAGDAPSVR
jgi:lysophospholipase L1-like esterase